MEEKSLQKPCRQRQMGTIMRDDKVHGAYREVLSELGHWASAVSRMEIYREVSSRTGVHWKTVQYILNHTTPSHTK